MHRTENHYSGSDTDDIEAAPDGQVDVLEQLFDFYIKERQGDPIAFKTGDLGLLFLELLGASAGVYNWPPAEKFSKNMATWLKYSFVVSNPASNIFFLLKALSDFFNSLLTETTLPPALASILNKPSNRTLIIKYLTIFTGSGICGIPFGIMTKLFPPPGCTSQLCIGFTVAHSILANAVLHALSFSLLLTAKFWYYRLPLLPFEKLYRWYRSTPQTKRAAMIEDIYTKYRSLIAGSLMASATQLVKNYRLARANPSMQRLTSLDALSETGNRFILDSFQEMVRATQADVPPLTSNRWWRLPLTLNVVETGGSALMMLACIGFITNPLYIANQEKSSIGYALASVPTYAMAVLCAFFGKIVFRQIYDFLTLWTESFLDKLPVEATLYPALYIPLMLFNAFIAVFSFATNLELIDTIFADPTWDGIRPFLKGNSIAMIVLLSFIPMGDLIAHVIRAFSSRLGKPEEDTTQAVRLLVKSAAMAARVNQLDGPQLISTLLNYSSETLQTFGINQAELLGDALTLGITTPPPPAERDALVIGRASSTHGITQRTFSPRGEESSPRYDRL